MTMNYEEEAKEALGHADVWSDNEADIPYYNKILIKVIVWIGSAIVFAILSLREDQQ